MGQGLGARCTHCGAAFKARVGGGFFFHLLHCDQCGREKVVPFTKLGDLHDRYVKGLSMPYCMASAEQDGATQARADIEPVTEAQYQSAIERRYRKCKCGGTFRFAAKARCPSCRSDEWEPTGDICCYD